MFFLTNLLTNWKTTLAGIAAILTAISSIASGGVTDHAIAALVAGIGLIFAKDFNVSDK